MASVKAVVKRTDTELNHSNVCVKNSGVVGCRPWPGLLVFEINSREKFMEMKKAQQADGAACILAIGRANPPNFILQKDYADYYFKITNSEHLIKLKDKFKRICDKTNIRKRHFFLTEEILGANPSMLTYGASSLDARRALAFDYVPKLCTEAAAKAIKEWGQPKSKITHLMTCSTLDLSMPGVDCEIAKLLELDPSVQRSPFHVVGCHSGPQLLRLAMDIARCNKHARILIVWSEVNIFNFQGPSQDNFGSLVGQSLFADGAAAVIVGADPKEPMERPLFQLIHGFQMSRFDARSPGCEILEMGQTICLPMELPSLVSKNIEDCLVKAMTPIGTTDWNSLFWIAHNAGPKVLDQIEVEIGLERQKLEVTRHVLSEYGHMGGVGVVFMLDEMRKRSLVERKATTGRGLDWGVMFGFGPGLTIETMVLHSVPLET